MTGTGTGTGDYDWWPLTWGLDRDMELGPSFRSWGLGLARRLVCMYVCMYVCTVRPGFS